MARFDFAFDPRFAAPLAVLGVRSGTAWVEVDDEVFDARFGHLRLRTGVDNLRCVEVTRGYRWWRAIGPRWSVTDGGATFGTNCDAGVCVCFHEPVGALFGRGRLPHPGLTVTVADVDGLVAAVEPYVRQ